MLKRIQRDNLGSWCGLQFWTYLITNVIDQVCWELEFKTARSLWVTSPPFHAYELLTYSLWKLMPFNEICYIKKVHPANFPPCPIPTIWQNIKHWIKTVAYYIDKHNIYNEKGWVAGSKEAKNQVIKNKI